MNIIRPIGKYLFLLGALNAWFAASAQVATPPCSAGFDILDGGGLAIASIPDDGPVLYVCSSDFLVLEFISTSAPSSGSTISLSRWDLGSSPIFNISAQYQFATDEELSVTFTVNDLDLCSDFATVVIKVLGQPGFEADVDHRPVSGRAMVRSAEPICQTSHQNISTRGFCREMKLVLATSSQASALAATMLW